MPMSTRSISPSQTTASQSVDAWAQPQRRAKASVSSGLRPTTVCITGLRSRSNIFGTVIHALEWARPMNFVPSSATLRRSLMAYRQRPANSG